MLLRLADTKKIVSRSTGVGYAVMYRRWGSAKKPRLVVVHFLACSQGATYRGFHLIGDGNGLWVSVMLDMWTWGIR